METELAGEGRRAKGEGLVSLAGLVAYARRCGLKSLAAWPEPDVEAYLRFHRANGSLVAAVDDRGEPEGLLVGWQTRLALGAQVEVPWSRPDPVGDAFYVANLAANSPAALRRLMRLMIARVPAWRSLVMIARRKGLLQVLPARYLPRIWKRALQAKGEGRRANGL